jgi:class 3 adenylate cyclase
VTRAIGERIDSLDASIGYASAACGGDIIFAEQMLKRGREVHLVLPFDADDFRRTSVDFGDKSMTRWRRRFDKLIKQARVHYATAEPYLGDDVLFDFANQFAQGLATVRAAELGMQPSALFLIDQASRSRTGGSMQMLKRWRKQGRTTDMIDLAALRDGLTFKKPGKQPASASVAAGRRANRRRIRSMLFSDVKNFSKLKEQQNPAFYAQFMGLAERVMDRCSEPPMYANTWGDALYMVFERAAPCADFAVRLIEQVEKTDWTVFDLPPDTTLRVGMHSGPVYQRYNRVTRRPDVLGTHVNRAARIEPVTTPGCAFVSEHFAAALAVEAPDHFACEYVGVVDLAKKFGRSGLYHLTRR